MMAEALLASGRPKEALEELQRAETSGWRSAPLFALRAEALDTMGRAREAREARNVAESMNSRFLEDDTMLVRFSHP